MNGWILYKRNAQELTPEDHGVNRLCASAQSLGIHLEVYKPEQFDLFTSNTEHNTIFIDKIRCVVPDFIIPRMGAESPYLALAIIRHFEQLGVYVCNASDAIATVKDKMHMSQKLRGRGLPTPKTLLVKFPISMSMVTQELGFPVVIKTISGARGFGVHLCESPAALRDLMELLSIHQNVHGLILQEFVAQSFGRDLRVFVLGGRVIGCMKRLSSGGFKANYSLGGTVESYSMTEEIQYLSLAATDLFNLDIAGIDLLFTSDGYTICEANSSPGFKGMEEATGSDIASQIINYIVSKVKP
jgi:gamma-F420-2:alpha-L-glutamate ligase